MGLPHHEQAERLLQAWDKPYGRWWRWEDNVSRENMGNRMLELSTERSVLAHSSQAPCSALAALSFPEVLIPAVGGTYLNLNS